MHTITLVCTTHESCGNCNSFELFKIIESINPEVIFEELSQANSDRSYIDDKLFTLETSAIKMYRQFYTVKQVPVDTYEQPQFFDERVDNMFDTICGNKSITECGGFRDLVHQLISYKKQFGFGFLNSDLNDELLAKINTLEGTILELLNDNKLSETSRMKKEVIEKREETILNNIYEYSEAHEYSQAILFMGSGHRRGMIEKIRKYELGEGVKVNWVV